MVDRVNLDTDNREAYIPDADFVSGRDTSKLWVMTRKGLQRHHSHSGHSADPP